MRAMGGAGEAGRQMMFGRVDPAQIELPLVVSPAEFRARLAAAGLGSQWSVTITENRATMVSFSGWSVRVHRAYLNAPDYVVTAIVRFVTAARRDLRRQAGRVILAYAPARGTSEVVPLRGRECTHPADEPYVERLIAAQRRYNAELFGGELRTIPVRVSRRMRRKLGHYCRASQGLPAEIAIGRRHIRDDSWDDVLHTLLHEMVHQWQDENGFALAHDARFRRKAREVGADPRATRRDDLRRTDTSLTAAVGTRSMSGFTTRRNGN